MEKKINIKRLLAVLCVFIMGQSGLAAIPVIHTISLQFPEVPYSSITLVANLAYGMVIPGALISGAIDGKYIKRKTLTLIGLAISGIGGVLVITANTFKTLLIFRAIWGFGFGAVYISENGNLNYMFHEDPKTTARILALSMIVMNLGGICYQNASGRLAAVRWNLWGLVYLMAFVSMAILIICFPNDEVLPTKEELQLEKANKTNARLPLIALFFGIAQFLQVLGFYPANLNCSTILAQRGLGDVAVAGFVSSLFTIGGYVSSFVFPLIYRYAKKYVYCIALLFSAVGELIVYKATSLGMIIVGMAFVGLAGFALPALYALINLTCDTKVVPIATSISATAIFGGMFACSPFLKLITKLTGDSIEAPLLVGVVLLVMVSAIFAIVMKNTKVNGIDD